MTPDNIRQLIELGGLVALLMATIVLTFILASKVSADEYLQIAPIAVAAIIGICKIWSSLRSKQTP